MDTASDTDHIMLSFLHRTASCNVYFSRNYTNINLIQVQIVSTAKCYGSVVEHMLPRFSL